MRYWVEYYTGVRAPVGVTIQGYYKRKGEKGAKPMSAKRAIETLRTNRWATGLIPAKEK